MISMFLRKWNDLPDFMKCDEVRPYYEILKKKKGSLVLKRGFDVIASLFLIIILAIPMGVIAIWIKLDSKGPVFFRQRRVTTYGKVFRIHKFRTMVDKAENLGTSVTVESDSRITKVGAKLRKYRIDEFPQIFDILAGNMSFVGTRPETVKYVGRYTNEMKATLLLPAGITSEASIYYKDEATWLSKTEDIDRIYVEEILPGKMRINLESIRQFNFLKELGIMLKTVCAVLQ